MKKFIFALTLLLSSLNLIAAPFSDESSAQLAAGVLCKSSDSTDVEWGDALGCVKEGNLICGALISSSLGTAFGVYVKNCVTGKVHVYPLALNLKNGANEPAKKVKVKELLREICKDPAKC